MGRVMICYIYLMQLGFHPVAAVGRLYKNIKETVSVHSWHCSACQLA